MCVAVFPSGNGGSLGLGRVGTGSVLTEEFELPVKTGAAAAERPGRRHDRDGLIHGLDDADRVKREVCCF